MLTRRPRPGLIMQINDGETFIDFDLDKSQIKPAIDAPDEVVILRDKLFLHESVKMKARMTMACWTILNAPYRPKAVSHSYY